VLTVLKRIRDSPGTERDLFHSYLAALRTEPEQVVWAVQRYMLRNIYDKREYGDKQIDPLMTALGTGLAAVRLLTRDCLAAAASHVTMAHLNNFSVSPARLQELAQELSAYNSVPVDQVATRLDEELHGLGGHIAAEWHEKRPVTSRQIERFYRETDAYLYELLIDGENPFRKVTRDAMMEALRKIGARRVFEFGGGIGTDAMWFTRAGLQWTYYDLPGGQTFRFASWRFQKQQVPVTVVTHPGQSRDNDAVISVEVFEHLPNLLAALRDINRVLRLGGLLIFTESFGKTERHPLHLTRTAIQGRFLNELVRAAGFEPVHRFGPEDCLYRTIKRREPTPFDWLHVIALIAGRVARKIPVKSWRTLSRRSPATQGGGS
jgi:SAM-dependent methyltransferase